MPLHNENQTFKVDEIPSQEISDPAVFSKDPMVSVHMITYNHEPYIAQAIEGVVKQETEYPFELIIGEDCSTDSTRKIVLEYQKKYPAIIRVIAWNKNVGMIKNGKKAISACRGKYIAICEGDDYWIDLLKLQKQVIFLENNPDYGLVHSDCDKLYQGSKKQIKNVNGTLKKSYEKCFNPFNGILTGDYSIFTCSVMVRTSLYMKSIDTDIFNNPKNLQGDLPAWLEMAKHCKFKYLKDSTTVYRSNLNSASKPASRLAQIEFQESSKRIRLEFAKKYNVSETLMQKVKIMYFSILLRKAFYLNDYNLAKKSYLYLKKFNQIDYILKYYGTRIKTIRPLIIGIRKIRKIWLNEILKIKSEKI